MGLGPEAGGLFPRSRWEGADIRDYRVFPVQPVAEEAPLASTEPLMIPLDPPSAMQKGSPLWLSVLRTN